MPNALSSVLHKIPIFHSEGHSVRTHDLLEIDTKPFISYQTFEPENLRKSPFVVVRRGVATDQKFRSVFEKRNEISGGPLSVIRSWSRES